MRRWGRAVGPWVTPTVVVVEVALVWSGVLAVRTAVVVGLLIELLLWATVASRVVVAGRRFRSSRAGGVDRWAAAEDALAELVPRPLARFILLEPRLWVCLARWIVGRSAAGFSYDSALRPLLWVVIVLVVVEGATVELVLAVALPGSPWVWVSLGVHCYAVLGLLAVLASFATRPHVLEDSVLRVRDGVFAELVVPFSAIHEVKVVHEQSFGRSGLKTRGDQALLAHGDATVRITFREPRRMGRADSDPSVTALLLSVDDPPGFVRAVKDRLAASESSPAG